MSWPGTDFELEIQRRLDEQDETIATLTAALAARDAAIEAAHARLCEAYRHWDADRDHKVGKIIGDVARSLKVVADERARRAVYERERRAVEMRRLFDEMERVPADGSEYAHCDDAEAGCGRRVCVCRCDACVETRERKRRAIAASIRRTDAMPAPADGEKGGE